MRLRLSVEEIERRQIHPRWYCLQTKGAKFDAVASEALKSYGLAVLFPRIKKPVKSVYGKTHEQTSALFPGYLFAKFDLGYFRSLGYVNGVVAVVGQGGLPEVVSESVIEEIRGRIGEDGFIRLTEEELQPGDKVEIVEGSFSGLTGVFVEGAGPIERVKILLDAINKSSMMQPTVIFDRAHIARLQA